MSSCLAPVELILFAATPPGPDASPAAAEHLRECDSCRERVAVLRKSIAASTAPTTDHLDEFALAELVDAESVNVVDVARIAHVASCADCRAALGGLLEIVRHPSVRAELERPEWRPRVERARPARRPMRIAIGGLAAAAAVLLAIQLTRPAPESALDPARLRHATIDVVAAPRLISPSGGIARVDTLRWTTLPGADRYRVTVFDENGVVAWESESADTFAVVPSAIAAQWRGRRGWRVKGRTGFDRWVDSEFGEFTVAGGAR